jgi:hypothetical protein
MVASSSHEFVNFIRDNIDENLNGYHMSKLFDPGVGIVGLVRTNEPVIYRITEDEMCSNQEGPRITLMDRKKVSIAKAEHPTTETNQIGTTVIPYMYKIYN